MSEKIKNAEKAKAKYHENETAEHLRKFIYRLKNGAIPTYKSLEKFNINLQKINEIRSEGNLPPIEKKDIKGAVIELELEPEPEPVKRGRGRPRQKIIYDIGTYISELGRVKVTPNSQETYERMLTFLLSELGYTSGSIVPYLNKNFKHIQDVINKMEQKRNEGELYSLGSKKIIYQSVSSGLYKNILPEFQKQMGVKATKWWNQEAAIIVSDVRQEQRDKTIINEPIINNWNDYKNKAVKFINDHNNSLEDRTFIQVYTLLGGVPRTNTFLNINVVKNKNEATDPDKNYYITTTKTLISNNHKNGINDGKENGKSIIVNLRTYPQILKNIESLAKQKNIIFNMSQNTASILFKNILEIPNRDLRKLLTTHVYNLPADKAHNAIRQEAKIQAHSIDTAKSVYKMRRGGNVLILS
jgi:hypothetical protein